MLNVVVLAVALNSDALVSEEEKARNPRIPLLHRLPSGSLLAVVVPVLYSLGVRANDRIRAHLNQVSYCCNLCKPIICSLPSMQC